jgi:hypothetical protein
MDPLVASGALWRSAMEACAERRDSIIKNVNTTTTIPIASTDPCNDLVHPLQLKTTLHPSAKDVPAISASPSTAAGAKSCSAQPGLPSNTVGEYSDPADSAADRPFSPTLPENFSQDAAGAAAAIDPFHDDWPYW